VTTPRPATHEPSASNRRADLWVSGAALTALMLLVMWAQHPTVACAMPREAAQRLILTRQIDREHLSRDRLEAVRIERRFAASHDGSAERQHDIDACEATLAREIVTLHGVTAEQARRE
jgi:hypothetical protein